MPDLISEILVRVISELCIRCALSAMEQFGRKLKAWKTHRDSKRKDKK